LQKSAAPILKALHPGLSQALSEAYKSDDWDGSIRGIFAKLGLDIQQDDQGSESLSAENGAIVLPDSHLREDSEKHADVILKQLEPILIDEIVAANESADPDKNIKAICEKYGVDTDGGGEKPPGPGNAPEREKKSGMQMVKFTDGFHGDGGSEKIKTHSIYVEIMANGDINLGPEEGRATLTIPSGLQEGTVERLPDGSLKLPISVYESLQQSKSVKQHIKDAARDVWNG
jgi:hypothetical protein